MTCPRCGKSLSPSSGKCPGCGFGVAVGTLTPPPTGGVTASDLTTLFGTEASADVAVEPATTFVSSETVAAPTGSVDAGATTFVPPEASTAPTAPATPGEAVTAIATALPSPAIPRAGSTSGDPLGVGQSFGSRYHVIRLLGQGGMGAVYQAWDAELGEAVAIKVVRPEITADPAAAADMERRFKRELVLARQVTHKNVVRIHDLGEIDGIKYITMPYVEGADLATVMREQGRLPLDKTLRIIKSVVSGLVAAHAADIVHRDLKPANIMVDANDEALIMDFGIARSTGMPVGSKLPGETTLAGNVKLAMAKPEATVLGTVIGTVEYMAPEQARGLPVDQRADMYALGLILYDMLAGRSRAALAKPIDELKARMEKAPPSIRTIVPEVPEALAAVVARCLEPDPAKRYQKTVELAADLDRLDENGQPVPVRRVVGIRLVAAVIVLLLALSGGAWWYARTLIPPPTHEPVSVLVADFQNLTGDGAFDGALEPALSISMEGASFITTYSRKDAVALAKRTNIGERLDESAARLVAVREGIKVVLTGDLEREGSGYRVRIRALDPTREASERPVAEASVMARDKSGVLATIAGAASRIRSTLGDTSPESARAASNETFTAGSLDALREYSRAQTLAESTKYQQALAAYQEAVRLDPEFGRAYSGMGVIYSIFKDDAKAKEAYDKALQLVDRMSEREKYRTLGTYYMTVARNYEKAIENYEKLVSLYPADGGGHGNLGLAYLFTGNIPRAIEEVRKLLAIYPNQWEQHYNYAMYSMYAGDFDTAINEGTRVLKEEPSFELAFLPVALSNLSRGNFDVALATYGELEKTSPSGAALARYGRADLEMYRGRFNVALKLLHDASAIEESAHNNAVLALDYVASAEADLALGQKRRAAEAATKAIALSNHESALVPAALVLIESGRLDGAEKVAAKLENMLQTHTTAHARLITAQIAVARGRYAQAIEDFRDSIKRRDTWFARYLLGKLYVETEHYPEAMAELELSVKRHGEVTDVFFYDRPTLRYLPPAFYWLGRAQQAVGAADASQNYEKFLALRADADPPDPLASDARKRLAALTH